MVIAAEEEPQPQRSEAKGSRNVINKVINHQKIIEVVREAKNEIDELINNTEKNLFRNTNGNAKFEEKIISFLKFFSAKFDVKFNI